MDAFDSDVLIYAAQREPRGDEVARLIASPAQSSHGIGSVVLVSEVLGAPSGRVNDIEQQRRINILANLDLKDVDYETADLAGRLRTKYRLKTSDALHLATAVLWGADRFHTSNHKDFGQHFDEIEIVFPA